jgi:hypothetical protein
MHIIKLGNLKKAKLISKKRTRKYCSIFEIREVNNLAFTCFYSIKISKKAFFYLFNVPELIKILNYAKK